MYWSSTRQTSAGSFSLWREIKAANHIYAVCRAGQDGSWSLTSSRPAAVRCQPPANMIRNDISLDQTSQLDNLVLGQGPRSDWVELSPAHQLNTITGPCQETGSCGSLGLERAEGQAAEAAEHCKPPSQAHAS